jgi:hypothetical protein
MSKTRIHARIIQHPFAPAMQGAQMDGCCILERGKRQDLSLEYRAFEIEKSELFEREGKIHERVQGFYAPARVRFAGVSDLKGMEYFANLPGGADDRTISTLMSWRLPGQTKTYHSIVLKAGSAPDLEFFAQNVLHECLPGQKTPFSIERDWCPAPPLPDRLLLRPQAVYSQFGGDPIPARIFSSLSRRRLFVGGIDVQTTTRPLKIDIVLNLGEEPSRWWAVSGAAHSHDFWDERGEGSEGMSVEEIRAEAGRVIGWLRDGKRVLVHCVAGMNRSTTICCAVLILLEGLTAEQALARVREHHPWGRPDSRHWLKLRWLAGNQ